MTNSNNFYLQISKKIKQSDVFILVLLLVFYWLIFSTVYMVTAVDYLLYNTTGTEISERSEISLYAETTKEETETETETEGILEYRELISIILSSISFIVSSYLLKRQLKLETKCDNLCDLSFESSKI